MSATGRNLEGHERHKDDFYETPAWVTRAILPHLGSPKTILDAGAGSGAILRACGEYFDERVTCIGIEQNAELVQRANEHEPYPDRDHFYECGDFFAIKGDRFEWPDVDRFGDPILRDMVTVCDLPFDLVIANPPYNDAERFIAHALTIGKTVAFLLRINWLASKKRAAFHRKHPSDLYVLPRRPSFTNGGTDATEYAWFVWGNYESLVHCNTCDGLGFIGDHRGAIPCSCENGKHRELAKRGNRWFLLDVES